MVDTERGRVAVVRSLSATALMERSGQNQSRLQQFLHAQLPETSAQQRQISASLYVDMQCSDSCQLSDE
jgi:hypothetical protein